MKMRELTTEEFQQAKDWVKSNILGHTFVTPEYEHMSLSELKHKAARHDVLMALLFPLPQEEEEDEKPKEENG